MEQVPQDQLTDFERPEIYSKKAIQGFSIFFTAIFGGVLLMQNLNALGKPKQGRIALLISIGITVIVGILANLFSTKLSSSGSFLSIIGALAFTELVYKKYIPNDAEYQKRKIWKPLIIGLVIFIPLIILIVYTVSNNPQ